MLSIRTIWLGGADDANYDDDVLMRTILMLTILMLTILMLTILMLTILKMLTTRTAVWNGWTVLQDIARYCMSASWQLGPRRRKAARQKGNMISRVDR